MRLSILLGCFSGYRLLLIKHLLLPLYLLYRLFKLPLLFPYLSLPLPSLSAAVHLPPVILLLLLEPLELAPEPLALPLLGVPHRLPLPLHLYLALPPQLLDLPPLLQVHPVAVFLGLPRCRFLGRRLRLGEEGLSRQGLLLADLLEAVQARTRGEVLEEAGGVLARAEDCLRMDRKRRRLEMRVGRSHLRLVSLGLPSEGTLARCISCAEGFKGVDGGSTTPIV